MKTVIRLVVVSFMSLTLSGCPLALIGFGLATYGVAATSVYQKNKAKKAEADKQSWNEGQCLLTPESLTAYCKKGVNG